MKLENIKLTDFKNGIWPSVDKSNIQSLIVDTVDVIDTIKPLYNFKAK